MDRAYRELGETPEVVAASLKQMRRFIYAERDREFTRTDDAFLLRFLRAKKFDVDKASKMVSVGAQGTRSKAAGIMKFCGCGHALPPLFIFHLI